MCDYQGVYVTSDLHFGHKNIIEYADRPFSSVTEMDDVMIKNWNNTIKKRHKVFVLGDFSFYSKDVTKQIVSKLNGYKVLIMGNHDRARSVNWWQQVGFNEVIQFPIIIDSRYVLSHEPLEIINLINIHGHVHNNSEYSDYSESHGIVCVERNNYTPIALNKLIQKINCYKER